MFSLQCCVLEAKRVNFKLHATLTAKWMEIKRREVAVRVVCFSFSQWAFFKLIKADIKSLLRRTLFGFTDVRPIN